MTADAEGTQDPELARLEKANFRAALDWALAHHDIELGLRLAVALENHWTSADPFEGARWFETLLADADGDRHEASCATRSARSAASCTSSASSSAAWRLYEESLALYRTLGDEWGEGHMLHRLAVDAQRRGELDRAIALSEEAREISRRQRDRKGEALGLARWAGSHGRGERGPGDRAAHTFSGAGRRGWLPLVAGWDAARAR